MSIHDFNETTARDWSGNLDCMCLVASLCEIIARHALFLSRQWQPSKDTKVSGLITAAVGASWGRALLLQFSSFTPEGLGSLWNAAQAAFPRLTKEELTLGDRVGTASGELTATGRGAALGVGTSTSLRVLEDFAVFLAFRALATCGKADRSEQAADDTVVWSVHSQGGRGSQSGRYCFEGLIWGDGEQTACLGRQQG